MEKGMLDTNLPVFRFPSGDNLTPAKLNKVLQSLLGDIFVTGSDTISCHSLRAGIPSALARHPELANNEDVQGWGRWKSDAYQKYTRMPHRKRRALFDTIVAIL